MHFKTTEHLIKIGGLDFTILSVTNFDELYEQLLAKGLQHEDVADERIPYWAELWPAAVGLATYLAENSVLLNGKEVLEIGCGLALPALAAARLGATATATDYLKDAVDFARKNAALNNIGSIKFETLDWRKPEGFKKYDVLLASDVAYERSQFNYLAKAFTHLVKPNGTILLSEPNRYIAQPFIESLLNTGYELKRYEYNVQVKEIQSKVSVYNIKPPAANL